MQERREQGMEKYTFKIVVVGDYAVGKTSLLNRYIDMKFNMNYLPTLGVNMLRKEIIHDNNKVKLMFWDIAGQELYASVREQFYEGTQGAILVYDVTRPESFANITKWYKEIIEVVRSEIYCILIANKVDLEKVIPTEVGQKIAEESKWLFLETSAKTGEGIEEAFYALIEYLINVYQTLE
ncbi:MAG: Rab family GTPase [Candidatus Helarchaeota archaeon]